VTDHHEAMSLTIEEFPDPRTHQPCAFCKAQPRYLAVIPEEGRKRLRGAIPLCNDCANDESVLNLIEEAAESFWASRRCFALAQQRATAISGAVRPRCRCAQMPLALKRV